MSNRQIFACFVLVSSLLPSLAEAQGLGLRSWGPRVGYRLGEESFDQVVFGVHADLGDVADNIRFAPNFEVGLGSNTTIFSIDPELHYVFRENPLGDNTFFYAGGGLGIHIAKFDVDDDVEDALDGFGIDVDDSETDLKVNLAAGVETQTSDSFGYFGEFRVSFIDGTWVEFIGGLNLFR